MPTITLTPTAQRALRDNGFGVMAEFSNGSIFAGEDYGTSNSAILFPLPSLPAGATINSVTLTLTGRSENGNGSHQGSLGIVANDGTLASQNLGTMPLTATA